MSEPIESISRNFATEVRVVDAKKGIVDYVASNASLDSYREIIRAEGWRFTMFRTNAPFLNAHSSWDIRNVLGEVTAFEVKDGELVERVQWAIGVGNDIAEMGWKMTEAGFLKAVSVGFWPVRYCYKDSSMWDEVIETYGIDEDAAGKARCIYLEQEQVELSAVPIGANPDALAKGYAAGVITEAELDHFAERARRAAATEETLRGGGAIGSHLRGPDSHTSGPGEGVRGSQSRRNAPDQKPTDYDEQSARSFLAQLDTLVPGIAS